MRDVTEIVAMKNQMLQIIQESRMLRSMPGRSEALRSSDSITATIAAAQLQAIQYCLGELKSPMIRSPLLKERDL